MKKIKLTANILFSGIGCQEYGWRKSNLFDIEVLNTSDIYKEAVLSYAAIHCDMTNEMVDSYDYPTKEEMIEHLTKINLGYDADKNKPFNWNKVKDNDLKKYYLACKLTNNLGDISKIEDLPYADFWTISFPCQSISICGKLKGFTEGSNTRSSLLWENIRLLKIAKEKNKTPKYLMFENVKNLLSKRFENDFKDLVDILDDLGFNIYYNVLNSKCCGVPQNRERVFVICIRKDTDTNLFTFPKPFDNGMRLKDILEDEVDEKYYISEAAQKKLKFITTNSKNDTFQLKQIAQMYGTDKEPNPQAGRVYSEDYICPTLDTCSGGIECQKCIENQE
jgi:DNA (cytosine-5)-methyltransferase 1